MYLVIVGTYVHAPNSHGALFFRHWVLMTSISWLLTVMRRYELVWLEHHITLCLSAWDTESKCNAMKMYKLIEKKEESGIFKFTCCIYFPNDNTNSAFSMWSCYRQTTDPSKSALSSLSVRAATRSWSFMSLATCESLAGDARGWTQSATGLAQLLWLVLWRAV